MNKPVQTGIRILCLLLLCTRMPVALAVDDAAVQQQLELLQQQITGLQARIRRLEQAATLPANAGVVAPSAQAPSVPAAAAVSSGQQTVIATDPVLQQLGQLRQSWDAVHGGMDSASVRALLGPAASEFSIERKPVWQYSYPAIGSGSVMFSVEGLVIGVQPPPFRYW